MFNSKGTTEVVISPETLVGKAWCTHGARKPTGPINKNLEFLIMMIFNFSFFVENLEIILRVIMRTASICDSVMMSVCIFFLNAFEIST